MITKNYIKMCEQAEEIQKLRRYKQGEWYYTEKNRTDVTNGLHIICDDWDLSYINSNREDNWITRSKGIWLPTQEQLWEKVWLILEKSPAIAYVFKIQKHETIISLNVGKYIDEGYERIYSGDTIKECLIQFIYREKYHKVWIGEKWVKAK